MGDWTAVFFSPAGSSFSSPSLVIESSGTIPLVGRDPSFGFLAGTAAKSMDKGLFYWLLCPLVDLRYTCCVKLYIYLDLGRDNFYLRTLPYCTVFASLGRIIFRSDQNNQVAAAVQTNQPTRAVGREIVGPLVADETRTGCVSPLTNQERKIFCAQVLIDMRSI